MNRISLWDLKILKQKIPQNQNKIIKKRNLLLHLMIGEMEIQQSKKLKSKNLKIRKIYFLNLDKIL